MSWSSTHSAFWDVESKPDFRYLGKHSWCPLECEPLWSRGYSEIKMASGGLVRWLSGWECLLWLPGDQKNPHKKLGITVHACNSSSAGGRGRRDILTTRPVPTWENLSQWNRIEDDRVGTHHSPLASMCTHEHMHLHSVHIQCSLKKNVLSRFRWHASQWGTCSYACLPNGEHCSYAWAGVHSNRCSCSAFSYSQRTEENEEGTRERESATPHLLPQTFLAICSAPWMCNHE